MILMTLILWVPFQLEEKITLRREKKRRAASVWQAPLSDSDFLTACGIAADTPEAETALTVRRELADAATKWIKPFKAENILPDMTCRELMRGWKPQMWHHDGFDSIGLEAVRKTVKQHSLSKVFFAQLIQPENKPRVTINELIHNYVDAIMQYKRSRTTELTPEVEEKVFILIGFLKTALCFAKIAKPSTEMNEFEKPIAVLSGNPSLSELSDTLKSVIGTCVGGQGSFWDFPTKTDNERKTLESIIEDICNTCHKIQDYYHWPRGY